MLFGDITNCHVTIIYPRTSLFLGVTGELADIMVNLYKVSLNYGMSDNSIHHGVRCIYVVR